MSKNIQNRQFSRKIAIFHFFSLSPFVPFRVSTSVIEGGDKPLQQIKPLSLNRRLTKRQNGHSIEVSQKSQSRYHH